MQASKVPLTPLDGGDELVGRRVYFGRRWQHGSVCTNPLNFFFRDMVEDLGSAKVRLLKGMQYMPGLRRNIHLLSLAPYQHIYSNVGKCPSRIHYNVDPTGKDDLLFQIDKQNFRLYDPTADPSPIYIRSKDMVEENDEIDNEKGREFAYERDLQNFLSRNLFLIDSGLTLYCEEDVSGLEFPVGNRFIDILAVDGDNNYVVIELKVSRGYDRTVGQLLRYMAWIRKYHAEQTQTVRGVIVARKYQMIFCWHVQKLTTSTFMNTNCQYH